MPQPSSDRFHLRADSPSGPARDAFMVAPDDTAPIEPLPKALLIGGAGTLTLRAVDAGADIAVAVTAGQILPIRAAFVRATGTTATQIVGLA